MTHRKWLQPIIVLSLLAALAAPAGLPAARAASQAACGGSTCVYLALVQRALDGTTGATYASGSAFQYDTDNPVRPADLHADKNITLRGYTEVTGQTGFTPSYISYGQDDNRGPQLGYLYSPSTPSIPAAGQLRFYQVNGWQWANSPAPGTPTGPLTSNWPITALGVPTTAGQVIYLPRTGVSNQIAPGYHALVMYADSTGLSVKYTGEDSVNPNGYALHIRGLAVDPNLLALYGQNNSSSGPRYTPCGGFRNCSYPLPFLSAGQPLGKAIGSSIIIAITDTGSFMDPRSCHEWWIGLAGGGGQPSCPTRDGVTIR